MPGQNANRTAYNSLEDRITPETVGDLALVWTWTSPRGRPVGSPAVSTAGVHVAAPPCHVATLQARDGRVRWQSVAFPVTEDLCLASGWDLRVEDPFVIGDSLYVASTATSFLPGSPGHERHTLKYDPATGEQLDARGASLEATRGSNAVFTAGSMPSTGTIVTWAVYGPIDGDRHRVGLDSPTRGTLGRDLYYRTTADSVGAYDPAGCGQDTCPPVWSITTDGLGTVPVLHPDGWTVYVVTAAGTVYALDAADGTVLWTAAVGADAMPTFPASPALAEGRLFVPTVEGLVVVDADGCGAATCEPQWSAPTGSSVEVQPAVGGDVVFAGTIDGSVHAFSAEGCGAATCEARWSAQAGSQITGGPVVSNGRLYVGTLDGHLVAYGLP